MSVAFYMDEHVHGSITLALRKKGIDVLTVQQDGMTSMADSGVLDRAAVLQRVVFTNDDDFLREATRRQKLGISFAGVIYGHPLRVTIRDCIEALEVIAGASEQHEHRDQIIYLPLK